MYLLFEEILNNNNININAFLFPKILDYRAFTFDAKKFYDEVQNLKFNMESPINNSYQLNIPELTNVIDTNLRKKHNNTEITLYFLG